MVDALSPSGVQDLAEMVQECCANATTLEIVAGATKSRLGRPMAADRRLNLGALSGIDFYEPDELVLRAGAATPLGEIEEMLDAHAQTLAFEPPDWRGLLGSVGTATIGGILATNLSGPRRFRAGAARDHILGFEGVNGRGEVFRSGGRVMKNVTGYDLSKLMAGSYGTLGLLAEVTVKVLPRAEKTRTLLLLGLGPREAVAAMAGAAALPVDISGAAYLPPPLGAGSQVAGVRGAVTALRLEGTAASVKVRLARLRAAFPEREMLDLHSRNSQVFWREVRDVTPLAGQSDRVIWRLSVAPGDAPGILESIRAAVAGEYFLDWAGGLLWLAVPSPDAGGAEDGGAGRIRDVTSRHGGHATLVVAPVPLRRAVDPFQPLSPGLAALTGRIKTAFDPKGILNPGRLYREV